MTTQLLCYLAFALGEVAFFVAISWFYELRTTWRRSSQRRRRRCKKRKP